MAEPSTIHEIDVRAGLAALLSAKKKQYPQHTNRISGLDEPCLRRLYYARHDWDKAAPIDDGLAGIFRTGDLLEPVIERIVSEAGVESNPPWRIVGSQMPTTDTLFKKYQISGTIDGLIQVRAGGAWETLGVIDIKTMSPNVYARIDGYDSLARYPWTAKYRGQVMLYSLAHNLDRCFLLLVNKSNLYDMKLVAFPLDMAYCEGLLQKAERINEAIAFDHAPDGVNDPDVCPSCPFYSFCHPDLTGGGNITIAESDELAAVLDRLEELAPTAKQIGELEDERDRLLVKGQDIVCGPWLVTWKQLMVQFKAQPAREVEQWRKKIVKAG